MIYMTNDYMTNDDLIRLYKLYSEVAYAHLKMGYTEESLLNARHVIAKALDVLRLLSIRSTKRCRTLRTRIHQPQLSIVSTDTIPDMLTFTMEIIPE